jgi:hypothetical protein
MPKKLPQGSPLPVGIARRRRSLRCGWSGPCVQSWAPSTARCSGSLASSGTGWESVRSWVRQSGIDDGYAPGASTAESARIKDLEQEVRELKRANAILKLAASFFGAELCATRRQVYREVMRDRPRWAVAAA